MFRILIVQRAKTRGVRLTLGGLGIRNTGMSWAAESYELHWVTVLVGQLGITFKCTNNYVIRVAV